MEKPLPSTSGHHHLSLAEPFVLVFYKTIFIWATMLHKLSLMIRFPSLHPAHDVVSAACTTSSTIHDVQRSSSSEAAGADPALTREDVETVMQILLGMGMAAGSDHQGEKLTDRVAYAELTDMFEEDGPSLAEVKEAFSVFDDNCDGFIDPLELQTVLSKLGFREGMALDACERMIALHDENRDGKIDFSEFVKFMESSLN